MGSEMLMPARRDEGRGLGLVVAVAIPGTPRTLFRTPPVVVDCAVCRIGLRLLFAATDIRVVEGGLMFAYGFRTGCFAD